MSSQATQAVVRSIMAQQTSSPIVQLACASALARRTSMARKSRSDWHPGRDLTDIANAIGLPIARTWTAGKDRHTPKGDALEIDRGRRNHFCRDHRHRCGAAQGCQIAADPRRPRAGEESLLHPDGRRRNHRLRIAQALGRVGHSARNRRLS